MMAAPSTQQARWVRRIDGKKPSSMIGEHLGLRAKIFNLTPILCQVHGCLSHLIIVLR